jgi:hypothetical protein
MSGLIKWRGKPEDVSKPISEPKRMVQLVRREAPRAETTTPARAQRSLPPATPQRADVDFDRAAMPPMVAAAGELIWLPRVCAVTGEGWIAPYIRDARGRFEPGVTFRMPEMLWRQYKANAAARVVDVGNCGNEECAWCAATYRGWAGPVTCSVCHAKLCLGRTTADGYFRCRPGCRGEGQLVPVQGEQIGFAPSLFRGGHAGR